jgi:hypothetical protein
VVLSQLRKSYLGRMRVMLTEPPSRAKWHRHTLTALWWNFGTFGRQDVHVHDCFSEDCCRVLIGPGRDCDGDATTHHRESLR